MNMTKTEERPKVRWNEIGEENVGQRLDNYLISLLKGVPKTRIYRIVRKGEVRVNKGRVEVKYRLKINDVVRIPPVRTALRTADILVQPTLKYSLENDIVYEDDGMIVFNKPSGFAVHGGSGINSGVIEALRQLRPEQRFLELVHRLDKETSGCLLVAKKRNVLKKLHELFRDDGVKKTYLALLAGPWQRKKQWVNEPLLKNISKGGERKVVVSQAGKKAETCFVRLEKYQDATLVHASPKTGRTHQIRVHAAWLGHPIVGDDRYGDDEVNRQFKKRGYRRLFLHAEQLQFQHPLSGDTMHFTAPLSKELQALINNEKQF
jgi:23S rRNA pseudouridine955/2504/2580 synthase